MPTATSIYILHTLLGPQGRDESICQDPVHPTPTRHQALLTQPLKFLSESSVPLVSPATVSGSLPTSFLLPWSTEATIGIQLKLFHGPSLTMGPWRQRQARTQDYWPLGLGTFHCPHSLEGKSLDVLGRHSPPRGLGQSLSISLLQGPKYGLIAGFFANKLLLEK